MSGFEVLVNDPSSEDILYDAIFRSLVTRFNAQISAFFFKLVDTVIRYRIKFLAADDLKVGINRRKIFTNKQKATQVEVLERSELCSDHAEV